MHVNYNQGWQGRKPCRMYVIFSSEIVDALDVVGKRMFVNEIVRSKRAVQTAETPVHGPGGAW